MNVIITQNSIVANINGFNYVISKGDVGYIQAKEAVKNDDEQSFIDACNFEKAVSNKLGSGVEVVNTINGEIQILYNGQPLHNVVTEAMLEMFSEGFDISPLKNFLERLMKNPSKRAVDELYNFLRAMGLVITPDGYFLAYKSVRSDLKDKYSGTIDNTPGISDIPRLERNQVDDNCNRHCSHGYHVGALEYAGPGGWYNNKNDVVVICKIDPADVVSVPTDHSYQKLRCCYYEPIDIYKGELGQRIYSGELNNNKPVNETESEYVDFDELLEGNCYEADYINKAGKIKHRYFMVEEISPNFGSYDIIVELLEPEENAGDFRTFSEDELANIQEYYW